MNEKEFINSLSEHGINPNNVCFDDNTSDDVFCVNANYGRVEVFYRERGKEYDLHIFQTMSSALEFLLERMLTISFGK